MRLLRVLAHRLSGLFARHRRDREFDEELSANLELLITDNIRSGMTQEAARRDALLKFGGIEATKENYRDRRGLPAVENLVRDLTFGVRMLRRAPVFTCVAVLSLAIGIGANSAFFSLADQMLIRALPVPEPEQLVFVGWQGQFIGGSSRGRGTFSYPAFRELQAAPQDAFTGIAARRQEPVDVSTGGVAQRATAELVSGNYFEVLRVGTVVGRPIGPEHDKVIDGSSYAVLSYGFWQRQFGGKPDILDRVVHVNGHPLTVIGVVEPSYPGLETLQPTDVFVPLAMKTVVTPTWDDRERRNSIWLSVVARLKPGVTADQAKEALMPAFRETLQRDVETVRGQRGADFPARYMTNTVVLSDARKGLNREFFRTPIYVLCSMVGVLLLIACVNVASLLITRAANRRKEIAIRLSLGASRGRLARLLATEALVIGAIAGAVGLLLSVWIMDVLISVMPGSDFGRILQSTPDWRVAAFTAVLSVFTSLLFGTAPAIQAARADANATLKEESTSSSMTLGQARFRKLLVCAQVALSLALLAGAGLFSSSLALLMSIDSGIAADRLLAFSIDPSLHRYTPERAHRLAVDLQAKLGAIPGVVSASGTSTRLLRNDSWQNTIQVEGHRPAPGDSMQAGWNEPLPGFFSTSGIALIAGREFTERDALGAPKVAIVNETFAKRFCGGGTCVGRRYGYYGTRILDIEIIGVVKDIRHNSLTDVPMPYTFTPALQNPKPSRMHFYVRAAGKPETLENGARQAVRSLDAMLPVVDLRTMRADIQQTHFTNRFFAFLSTAFAAVATLLACIGLYGVTSYMVSRRTQEFGVRVALGAGRAEIVRLVAAELARLTAVGITAGVGVALVLGRLLESQLFEMKGNDPVVLSICAGLMTAAAVLAAWFPTRRALRIDPVRALRYE